MGSSNDSMEDGTCKELKELEMLSLSLEGKWTHSCRYPNLSIINTGLGNQSEDGLPPVFLIPFLTPNNHHCLGWRISNIAINCLPKIIVGVAQNECVVVTWRMFHDVAIASSAAGPWPWRQVCRAFLTFTQRTMIIS